MININYTNHWGGNDINSTIQQSIIDTFGKLRYQAQDNPKVFRAILELVIMQDIMEWAGSVITSEEELNAVQATIIEKQKKLILCNPDISIQYLDSPNIYTNVNTPQDYYDWTRVWDRPNVTIPTQTFEPKWIKVSKLIFEEIIP